MLNRERFEHIFNLYYRPLCKYLLLFTDDFETIEDTVQTVYVKLWEDREKISDDYIKTYLFVSARNKILNSIRDQNRRRDLLHDYFINELAKEQAEDIVDLNDFVSRVEQSIEDLPPKTKEIFRLSRYDNMSYKDIADKENISIKTVENHIAKALKRINGYLRFHYNKE